MRSVLILAILLIGWMAYQQYALSCQLPTTYRIGDLDARFDLTPEEARAAVERAEAVWEETLGRDDVFSYHERGDIVVNFVYDERQANAEAEYGFRERLDQAEQVNDEIRVQYQSLTTEYDSLVGGYETRLAVYEDRLDTYNKTVARYNAQGGAPTGRFAELEAERAELQREEAALDELAETLNSLVDRINQLGQQGNLLVEQYNRGVGEYNKTFGESREFTQGDYRGDEINIYTFADPNELTLVLAHELGHALGISHVEGRASIMYYLIGEQPAKLRLSSSDQAAFTAACTGKTLWDRIVGS